jgi:sugar O-acyltransferase (sialic acid O-acetyltransferase NeuD family)
MIFNIYANVLKNAYRIIIHGAGGNTRTIIGILKSQNYVEKLFCIDKALCNGETILGVPVINSLEFRKEDIHLISFGDALIRASVYNNLKSNGYRIGNCISQDAIIYNSQILDTENNQIFNLAYLGPDVIIGNNNIINTYAIIEHEVVLKDNIHVAPGSVICGRVCIGNNVFIGANSVIRDKISVCDNVTIGAGSVVISEITEPGTYVGNPVRKIK